MSNVKSFSEYLSSMNESDGFGTLPFLEKKNGNVYYYFFKLDSEKKKGTQRGYMVTLGKYSQYEDTPGSKNSYAVLNVNEIGTEVIDDLAVERKEIPVLNETSFQLTDGELSRFFEQTAKAVQSYLEQNPKVVRFYDEMQDNIDADNYLEYLKSVLVSALGGEWTAQEGSNKKVVLIGR